MHLQFSISGFSCFHFQFPTTKRKKGQKGTPSRNVVDPKKVAAATAKRQTPKRKTATAAAEATNIIMKEEKKDDDFGWN